MRVAAPLVATSLLFATIYVLSYLALVVPGGFYDTKGFALGPTPGPLLHYRIANDIGLRIYWPLEQIDRRLRHVLWYPPEVELGIDFEE